MQQDTLMLILLRNLKTGQYHQSPDKWALNRKEGHDFETLNQAIAFARENHFESAEVVLSFDDPQRDIHFPLRDHS